jgi:uncharacterized membrane protein
MTATTAARSRLTAVLALGLVPLLFHLFIAETSHVHFASLLSLGALFKMSLVTVSALTHWAIYGGLLATFGSTLRPGRDALITAMARRLHGPISDELALYTRRVTWAWCGFFAVQFTTSVALFAFAPLVVWSFFVNVLDIPLVATMFGAEYIFRVNYLQDPPRHSVAAIIDMIVNAGERHEKPANSP